MDGLSDAYRGRGGNNDRRSYSGQGGRPSYSSRTPYDRHDHRSAPSSSSSFRPRESKPQKLEDVYESEELISAEQFSRYTDVANGAGVSSYAQYVTNHRRSALIRFFQSHKNDAWFLEQFEAFKGPKYMQSANEKTITRSMRFKSAMEGSSFEEISLEDGEDLNVTAEAEAKVLGGNGVRSFPVSMKLPDRLAPLLHRRGNVLSLSNIPPAVSAEELEAILKDASENKLIELELSAPMPEKTFYRLGWATFEDGLDLNPIVARVEDRIIHGDKIYCSTQKYFSLQIKIAPSFHSTPDRINRDLQLARRLVTILNNAHSVDNWIIEAIGSFSDARQLDLLIAYLRQVFFVCFYSATMANGPQDLARQCGDLFVRSKAATSTDSTEEEAASFEAQQEDLCSKLEVNFDEATEDQLLEKMVTKIDEGRFKCGECPKLFKGPDFVIKHLRTKHEDVVKRIMMETVTLNNFLKRPSLFALLPLPMKRRASATSHSSHGSTGATNDYRSRGSDYYGRHRLPDRPPRGVPTRRPPPPPEGAQSDPRKIREYRDWDAPAIGDVDISYD